MRKLSRGTLFAILWAGAILTGCGGLLGNSVSITHTVTPTGPMYMQLITDCNTGVLVSPNSLIQPSPGCDGWGTNRYERPFNADSQDEYFPDLDILQAELGEANGWFYLRMELFDLREGEKNPLGTYAIELDLDQDKRGDALVLAIAPGLGGEKDWSVAGMQVWEDSDQTVGNQQPSSADHPFDEDGYDKLLFNEGVGGNDPDVAWARFVPGERAIVEIAFKSSLINNDDTFVWRVWAQQSMDPTQMDYHDAIEHEDAGDAYESQTFFPSKDIYKVDNTCAALWGGPSDDDPSLCVNDPYVPHPTPGPGTATFTPPVHRTPTETGTPRTATPTSPGDGSFTPSPTDPMGGCEDGDGLAVTCTPTYTITPSPTFSTGGCEDDNGNAVTCTPTPTERTVTPNPSPTPTPTRPCDPNPLSNNNPCTPTPTLIGNPNPSPTPTNCSPTAVCPSLTPQ